MDSIDEDLTPLDSSADSAVLTGGTVVTTIVLDMLNNGQMRS